MFKKNDCPDKLFKLFNNVVDVAFKLLIDNIDDVDKLFKLVFNANTGEDVIVDEIAVVVNWVELSWTKITIYYILDYFIINLQ